MFNAPWICRRCIQASLRPARRKLLRLASTTATTKDGAFSPALLARARNMAAEHDRLTEETAETFDVKLAKRIGELKSVTSALKAWEEAQSSISELQLLLADPQTDAELRELAVDDLVSTKAEMESLSQELAKSLTPKHPFAELPCLLEIRPGVGGGEASLFAGDMLRMYQSYCSRVGLRTSILKYDAGEGEGGSGGEPPINEAVLEIENPGAYGQLRSEAGVHRVQRVPATESKGRTHTSAVGVLVLPSFPVSDSQGKEMWEVDVDDPESDYFVDVKDVRTDVLRASGAGGQHVNKTESAVRLTHIPTNTVVSMQDSRSQHQNRAKAWMLLRSKLAQAKREAREEELARMRNSVLGNTKMGRGDKVRTYNYGQQRVTDHRSGVSVYNLNDVMEGGMELDKIVDSVKQWFVEREIEGMLADDENAASAAKKKKK